MKNLKFLTLLALMSCSTDPEDQFCKSYNSNEEEFAPIPIVENFAFSVNFPESITVYTSRVEFEGVEGAEAQHEGIDYINNDRDATDVPIYTIGSGTVVYARTGCVSSSQFASNTLQRECGAGWGNHLVIQHSRSVFSRYAHLRTDGVLKAVGEQVEKNEIIGIMGNSGRSDMRHLHLEIGKSVTPFRSCASSQSFESVTDPGRFGL